ncbi:hypothetical protein O9993_06900 [Vibrio lentus]|nr:hypothetical protein [Vibrio lentus]
MNTYINRINQPSPQSKALLLLLSLAAVQQLWLMIPGITLEQTFDNCVLRQIHMDVEQDSLEKLKLSVTRKNSGPC